MSPEGKGIGDAEQQSRYLIKNGLVTTGLRGVGAVAGVIVDGLIIAKFGIGKETDAFFAAITVPWFLSSILECEAPKILVPAFARCLSEEGRRATWRLVSNVVTVTALGLAALAVCATLLSGYLMRGLAPGLQTELHHLSSSLARVVFWLVVARAVGCIFSSLLYCLHRYVFPAATKVTANVVAIGGIFLLEGEYGIRGIAWAFLLGAVAPCVMMLVWLSIVGFRYRLSVDLRCPRLRQIGKVAVYPCAGNALSSSRMLVENFLASFLGAGSLSVVRYASRVVQCFAGVVVSGMVVPVLPMVAHFVARKDYERMKVSIIKGLKLISTIAVPMGVWLCFVTEPLLLLVFGEERFGGDELRLLVGVIATMVPYILFTRIVTILQTPFFSTMDMVTPTIGTVLSFGVHAVLCFVLFGALGVYAFSVAISITSVLAALYMYLMMRRRFGGLGWSAFPEFATQIVLMGIGVALACYGGLRVSGMLGSGSLAGGLGALLLPSVGAFVVCYVGRLSVTGRLWGRRVARAS